MPTWAPKVQFSKRANTQLCIIYEAQTSVRIARGTPVRANLRSVPISVLFVLLKQVVQ